MPATKRRVDPHLKSDRLASQEIDRQLRLAIAEMQRAESKAVLLFYEMMRKKHYRQFGCSTIQQYAKGRLGFSESKTYQFIRLCQDLERLPRLRSALRKNELGWTKARELTKVASVNTEEQWIDEARSQTRDELVKKIKRAQREAKDKKHSNPRQGCLQPVDASRDETECDAPSPPIADGPVSVTFRFTPLELARYEVLSEKLRKSRQVPASISREGLLLLSLRCLLESGPESESPSPSTPPHKSAGQKNRNNKATQSHLLTGVQYETSYSIVVTQCESCGRGAVQTNPGEKILTQSQMEAVKCDAVITKNGERNRRTIPPSLRSEVLSRDHHTCQAPGCSNRRFLEIHHLQSRAKGGKNERENLMTLCSGCHQLWHERKIVIKPRRE